MALRGALALVLLLLAGGVLAAPIADGTCAAGVSKPVLNKLLDANLTAPAGSVFQFGHAPFNATASYLFLTTKVGTTITPYVSSLVGPYTDLSAITWKNAYGNAASTIAPASDLPKGCGFATWYVDRIFYTCYYTSTLVRLAWFSPSTGQANLVPTATTASGGVASPSVNGQELYTAWITHPFPIYAGAMIVPFWQGNDLWKITLANGQITATQLSNQDNPSLAALRPFAQAIYQGRWFTEGTLYDSTGTSIDSCVFSLPITAGATARSDTFFCSFSGKVTSTYEFGVFDDAVYATMRAPWDGKTASATATLDLWKYISVSNTWQQLSPPLNATSGIARFWTKNTFTGDIMVRIKGGVLFIDPATFKQKQTLAAITSNTNVVGNLAQLASDGTVLLFIAASGLPTSGYALGFTARNEVTGTYSALAPLKWGPSSAAMVITSSGYSQAGIYQVGLSYWYWDSTTGVPGYFTETMLKRTVAANGDVSYAFRAGFGPVRIDPTPVATNLGGFRDGHFAQLVSCMGNAYALASAPPGEAFFQKAPAFDPRTVVQLTTTSRAQPVSLFEGYIGPRGCGGDSTLLCEVWALSCAKWPDGTESLIAETIGYKGYTTSGGDLDVAEYSFDETTGVGAWAFLHTRAKKASIKSPLPPSYTPFKPLVIDASTVLVAAATTSYPKATLYNYPAMTSKSALTLPIAETPEFLGPGVVCGSVAVWTAAFPSVVTAAKNTDNATLCGLHIPSSSPFCLRASLPFHSSVTPGRVGDPTYAVAPGNTTLACVKGEIYAFVTHDLWVTTRVYALKLDRDAAGVVSVSSLRDVAPTGSPPGALTFKSPVNVPVFVETPDLLCWVVAAQWALTANAATPDRRNVVACIDKRADTPTGTYPIDMKPFHSIRAVYGGEKLLVSGLLACSGGKASANSSLLHEVVMNTDGAAAAAGSLTTVSAGYAPEGLDVALTAPGVAAMTIIDSSLQSPVPTYPKYGFASADTNGVNPVSAAVYMGGRTYALLKGAVTGTELFATELSFCTAGSAVSKLTAYREAAGVPLVASAAAGYSLLPFGERTTVPASKPGATLSWVFNATRWEALPLRVPTPEDVVQAGPLHVLLHDLKGMTPCGTWFKLVPALAALNYTKPLVAVDSTTGCMALPVLGLDGSDGTQDFLLQVCGVNNATGAPLPADQLSLGMACVWDASKKACAMSWGKEPWRSMFSAAVAAAGASTEPVFVVNVARAVAGRATIRAQLIDKPGGLTVSAALVNFIKTTKVETLGKADLTATYTVPLQAGIFTAARKCPWPGAQDGFNCTDMSTFVSPDFPKLVGTLAVNSTTAFDYYGRPYPESVCSDKNWTVRTVAGELGDFPRRAAEICEPGTDKSVCYYAKFDRDAYGAPMCRCARNPDYCIVEDKCRAKGETQSKSGVGPCLACQPANATDAWTFVAGATCDDGNLCTAKDTCRDNKCAGTPLNCLRFELTNDYRKACEVCTGEGCAPDPAFPGCVYTATDGAKSCGCSIAGSDGKAKCYPDGAKDPNNACAVCDVLANPGGWSPAPPVACNDGNPCTYDDTCVNAQCTGTAYACEVAGACMASNKCDGVGGCKPTWAPASTICLARSPDACEGDWTCSGQDGSCSPPPLPDVPSVFTGELVATPAAGSALPADAGDVWGVAAFFAATPVGFRSTCGPLAYSLGLVLTGGAGSALPDCSAALAEAGDAAFAAFSDPVVVPAANATAGSRSLTHPANPLLNVSLGLDGAALDLAAYAGRVVMPVLRVTDLRGNTRVFCNNGSQPVTFGVSLVDPTPGSVTNLRPGAALAETVTTHAAHSLRFAWSGFVPGSLIGSYGGALKYDFAVGSAPGLSDVSGGWVTAGIGAASAEFTGPAPGGLPDGTYYVTVRGKQRDGRSATAGGAAVTIDTTGPALRDLLFVQPAAPAVALPPARANTPLYYAPAPGSRLAFTFVNGGDAQSGVAGFSACVGTSAGDCSVQAAAPVAATGASPATFTLGLDTEPVPGVPFTVTLTGTSGSGATTALTVTLCADPTAPGTPSLLLGPFLPMLPGPVIPLAWSAPEDYGYIAAAVMTLYAADGGAGAEALATATVFGEPSALALGATLPAPRLASLSTANGTLPVRACVLVVGANGLPSGEACGTSVLDLTPPSPFTVNDTAAADSAPVAGHNKPSLRVVFSASEDPESGIGEVAVRVTAAAGPAAASSRGAGPGASQVLPWTPLSADALAWDSADYGLTTTAAAPLRLSPGTLYYVSVRVTNGAGGSRVATSAGVVLDATAPDVSAVGLATGAMPGSGAAWAGSSTAVNVSFAAAAEPDSWVSSYALAIGTAGNPTQYAAWVPLPPDARAYAFAGLQLPKTAGAVVSLKATNVAGLSATATLALAGVDESPPDVTSVAAYFGVATTVDASSATQWAACGSTIPLAWTAATDAQSGIASYAVSLVDAATGEVVTPPTTVAAGAANTATLALPSGGRAHGAQFAAKIAALNRAGLASSTVTSSRLALDCGAPTGGQLNWGADATKPLTVYSASSLLAGLQLSVTNLGVSLAPLVSARVSLSLNFGNFQQLIAEYNTTSPRLVLPATAGGLGAPPRFSVRDGNSVAASIVFTNAAGKKVTVNTPYPLQVDTTAPVCDTGSSRAVVIDGTAASSLYASTKTDTGPEHWLLELPEGANEALGLPLRVTVSEPDTALSLRYGVSSPGDGGAGKHSGGMQPFTQAQPGSSVKAEPLVIPPRFLPLGQPFIVTVEGTNAAGLTCGAMSPLVTIVRAGGRFSAGALPATQALVLARPDPAVGYTLLRAEDTAFNVTLRLDRALLFTAGQEAATQAALAAAAAQGATPADVTTAAKALSGVLFMGMGRGYTGGELAPYKAVPVTAFAAALGAAPSGLVDLDLSLKLGHFGLRQVPEERLYVTAVLAPPGTDNTKTFNLPPQSSRHVLSGAYFISERTQVAQTPMLITPRAALADGTGFCVPVGGKAITVSWATQRGAGVVSYQVSLERGGAVLAGPVEVGMRLGYTFSVPDLAALPTATYTVRLTGTTWLGAAILPKAVSFRPCKPVPQVPWVAALPTSTTESGILVAVADWSNAAAAPPALVVNSRTTVLPGAAAADPLTGLTDGVMQLAFVWPATTCPDCTFYGGLGRSRADADVVTFVPLLRPSAMGSAASTATLAVPLSLPSGLSLYPILRVVDAAGQATLTASDYPIAVKAPAADDPAAAMRVAVGRDAEQACAALGLAPHARPRAWSGASISVCWTPFASALAELPTSYRVAVYANDARALTMSGFMPVVTVPPAASGIAAPTNATLSTMPFTAGVAYNAELKLTFGKDDAAYDVFVRSMNALLYDTMPPSTVALQPPAAVPQPTLRVSWDASTSASGIASYELGFSACKPACGSDGSFDATALLAPGLRSAGLRTSATYTLSAAPDCTASGTPNQVYAALKISSVSGKSRWVCGSTPTIIDPTAPAQGEARFVYCGSDVAAQGVGSQAACIAWSAVQVPPAGLKAVELALGTTVGGQELVAFSPALPPAPGKPVTLGAAGQGRIVTTNIPADTSVYPSVRFTTRAGVTVVLAGSAALKVDAKPPTPPAAVLMGPSPGAGKEGTGSAQAWERRPDFTSLGCHWAAGADAEGPVTYLVALGYAPRSFELSGSFIDMGTARAYTLTDAALASKVIEAPVYCTVITRDAAGNEAVAVSDYLAVRRTPPASTRARVAAGLDAAFHRPVQARQDGILIAWDRFDNLPAYAAFPLAFEAAVGTTPGASNTLPWTALTEQATAFLPIPLLDGGVYYVMVRAKDVKSGLTSAAVVSPRITIDAVPPSVGSAAYLQLQAEALAAAALADSLAGGAGDAASLYSVPATWTASVPPLVTIGAPWGSSPSSADGGRCEAPSLRMAFVPEAAAADPKAIVAPADGLALVCAAGSTWVPALGVCAPCPPGTFKGEPGNGACTKCTNSTGGALPVSADRTSCTCPSGLAYVPGAGCVCPAGRYSTVLRRIGAVCTLCPSRTYKPRPGNDAADCKACPAGLTAGPGSTTCAAADGGKLLDAATGAVKCAAGYGANTDCGACPPGTSSPEGVPPAGGFCKPCPAGTIVSSRKCAIAASASWVPTGAAFNAAAWAVVCPAGTRLAATPGGSACLPCASGTVAVGPQSLSPPDTTPAPAGYLPAAVTQSVNGGAAALCAACPPLPPGLRASSYFASSDPTLYLDWSRLFAGTTPGQDVFSVMVGTDVGGAQVAALAVTGTATRAVLTLPPSTPQGVPLFVSIFVEDGLGRTTSHAVAQPVMLDAQAPLVGRVLDGSPDLLIPGAELLLSETPASLADALNERTRQRIVFGDEVAVPRYTSTAGADWRQFPGFVYAQGVRDFSYWGDAGTWNVTFEPIVDPGAGLAALAACLGSAPGLCDTAGPAPVLPNTTVQLTQLTGLALTEGATYYASIIAVDKTGNVAYATTDGAIVATAAPKGGYVADGLLSVSMVPLDADCGIVGEPLAASWGGFSSAVPVVGYDVAFGSAPGLDDVVPWTDVGITATYATYPKAWSKMVPRVYATVRLRAVSGLSITASSDGITFMCPSPGATEDELLATLRDPRSLEGVKLAVAALCEARLAASSSTGVGYDGGFETLADGFRGVDAVCL